VINLHLQNDALLLKELSKFYNKEDIPQVQLVWSKYYDIKVPHAAREMGSFFGGKMCNISDFRTTKKCELFKIFPAIV
jgi:hypothetical protein